MKVTLSEQKLRD